MRRAEQGQVAVMIVGFFVVVALLAVVVVNSSAAFLQRQRLDNLADGAALAAANAVRAESVYAEGIGAMAPLDLPEARRVVEGYLASAGARVLRWDVTTDGVGVRVRLERIVELPLAPPGWRDRSTVTAEATAQLRTPP